MSFDTFIFLSLAGLILFLDWILYYDAFIKRRDQKNEKTNS